MTSHRKSKDLFTPRKVGAKAKKIKEQAKKIRIIDKHQAKISFSITVKGF